MLDNRSWVYLLRFLPLVVCFSFLGYDGDGGDGDDDGGSVLIFSLHPFLYFSVCPLHHFPCFYFYLTVSLCHFFQFLLSWLSLLRLSHSSLHLL